MLLFFVIGMALFTGDRLQAESYFTSQSTGVNISSRTSFFIEKLILSTGPASSWILLVDSDAASVGDDETNLAGVGVCENATWPVAQWLMPKILYADTATVNATGLQVIPIGRTVENGLVICQNTRGGTWTLVTSRVQPKASYGENPYGEPEDNKNDVASNGEQGAFSYKRDIVLLQEKYPRKE